MPPSPAGARQPALSFPVSFSYDEGLPGFHSEPELSPAGIPYFRAPGVLMMSRPQLDMSGLFEDFLSGFAEEFGFANYSQDDWDAYPASEMLCKVAGQLCYLSFGERRTKNEDRESYFENILSSGHGSVLEHANFSFLLYGVSRSLTHELVRHRAGFAFSQVSQRYVSGSLLRFVMRPEFQGDETLEHLFFNRIEKAAADYEKLAQILLAKRPVPKMGDSKTEMRKAVNQAARACLPNETEAPILVTANIRSWRHLLNMRGSLHAEPEIRSAALRLHSLLISPAGCPALLSDCAVMSPEDQPWVRVGYPKV